MATRFFVYIYTVYNVHIHLKVVECVHSRGTTWSLFFSFFFPFFFPSVPEDCLTKVVAEFQECPELGFLQCRTTPLREGDNYWEVSGRAPTFSRKRPKLINIIIVDGPRYGWAP